MPPQKNIAEEFAKILREALPPRDGPKRRKRFWIVLSCTFLMIAVIVALAISSQSSPTEPNGKITQPETGSLLSRAIHISGYTENIPPDRPFVVIAVNHKDKNLCWPTICRINGACRNRTSIRVGSFYNGNI